MHLLDRLQRDLREKRTPNEQLELANKTATAVGCPRSIPFVA